MVTEDFSVICGAYGNFMKNNNGHLVVVMIEKSK